MNEYNPLILDVALCVPKVQLMPLLVVKANGRKLPAEPSTLATPTGRQWAQEAQTKIINACKKAAEDNDNEKSSASAKSAKMMKSISKMIKSLEKDNRRLKKSVSAL
jgi:phage-related tail protein